MRKRNIRIFFSMTIVALFIFVSGNIISYAQDSSISNENAPQTKEAQIEDVKNIKNVENKETVEDIKNNNDNITTPDLINNEQELNQPETNDGSLFYTVKRGGILMIFIILLGLVSLTIIVERVIHYTRNHIWTSNEIESILRKRSDESDAEYREDREDELRGVLQLYVNSMEKGLAFLSGIGNLSPIVGFLGTVIGMIAAFASIASATTVNARVVAVGIQIALITTAGGLVIAAPTIFFFYLFSHIIHTQRSRGDEVITDLCKELPRLSERLDEELA